MDEDHILIGRFRSGDLGGFEMLVKKYQNKAVNIAYSLTFNLANAQDIAQDAFLKVYGSLKSFHFESKFSTWFYRVVVNCAYDFLRKNKRNTVQLEDCHPAELVYLKDDSDYLAKELVSQALQKVPFKYRSAVKRHLLQRLAD